jgi:hypothetical protein
MNSQKENPFINLLANIILPVFILNKTSYFPGEHKALFALGVALLFPISYGLWDLFKNSKTNYFSILGLVNTLITGLFAVFALSGFWFAVKEAALPACLGIGVYISSVKNKPFIKNLIASSGMFDMALIEEKSNEQNNTKELHQSFLNANSLFSISFFISAFLNFVLAIYIFKPIAEGIAKSDQAIILNQQISKMTWAGMLVISVPMVFFLGFTFYRLLKDLEKTTGLTQEEILKTP